MRGALPRSSTTRSSAPGMPTGRQRRPANALSSRQPQLGDPGPLPCAEGGSALAAGRGAARGAGPRRSVPRETRSGGTVSDRGDPPVAGHLLEDGDQPSGSARPRARSRERRALSGKGQTLADRGDRGQLRPREDGAALLVYAHYANQISRADGTLPFFARMSEIEPSDDAPDLIIARAISKTYKSMRDRAAGLAAGPAAPAAVPVVSRRRPGSGRPAARRGVRRAQADPRSSRRPRPVTLDEQVIGQLPALRATNPETDIPIMLVQLLSPATVAQYSPDSATSFSRSSRRFRPRTCSISRVYC